VDGGWLVFRRSTRLYAAPFDVDQLDMTGEARPVFADVSFNDAGSQTSAFALSRTGALVYVPAPQPREAAQLTWIDRRGREEPAAGERQDYSWPTLDPRGERIAVHITRSDQTDLWVYDIRTQAWRWRTRGLSTGEP
jgi:Tol biopolymer transport system component